MKKIVTLLLAFALAIPAYVTHQVYTAQQEPDLECDIEWQYELSSETEPITYLEDDFLFFCPVDLALEKGLGQTVNEKIVTEDYTITIEMLIVDGNTLHTKAHVIASEEYLIDENVHIMLNLGIFTHINEEAIYSRFFSPVAEEPFYSDIMPIADSELFFDDVMLVASSGTFSDYIMPITSAGTFSDYIIPIPFGEGFNDYYEAGFEPLDYFELSELLMMPRIGSSSMGSFMDSTGTVTVTNSMYFEDDFELEKIYVAVEWLEIVRNHEMEFSLAELADGANGIFDEVAITQEDDRLIIETKIFHSQPQYHMSQMPHFSFLFVDNEEIWVEAFSMWSSDEYAYVMNYEFMIPSDIELDFIEAKLTMLATEELFSEYLSEDSTIIEIQIDQEKILQQLSEEIAIDKTISSAYGSIIINSIILNNLTFELIYTYIQTYDFDGFASPYVEVSENVFKSIVEVRLLDGSRLFSIGGSSVMGSENSFADRSKYLLVDDIENIVIAVLTHDNVYETIYLSDFIDR